MIENFIAFVSRIVFGKQYSDGYMKEPEKKKEYRLVSLFPNDIAKEKAINFLEKR